MKVSVAEKSFSSEKIAPPVAYPTGGRTPIVGVYRRLRAIITDPLGLVEHGAAEHGDIFTLRIPFAFDLTYVLGADAYRDVMSLPAEQATMGPVFGNVPTVGFWFPRSGRDTESLQSMVLAGRRLIAELMTSARIADLAESIPDIVARRTQAWGDRIDLATEIHPIIYEGSCRALLGDRVWSDIGEQIIPLFRAIADGIDIPRATLAKTPLHFFMPEYRATKHLHRVLRGAVRGRDSDSPLLDAVAEFRIDGAPLSEADQIWMVMYVLWNATAYPGSYTFWTLIDILTNPEIRAELRTESDRLARQDLLSRCLLETIRLNPVSSLVRSLTTPVDIEHNGRSYRVPAGGYLGVFLPVLNRDPERVSCPHAYRPDRHIGEPTGPLLFGRGAFGCVAREFSKTLTSVTLDAVLTRYELAISATPPQRRCRVHLTYPSAPTPALVQRAADIPTVA